MSESVTSQALLGGTEHGTSPRRWGVVASLTLLGGFGVYNQIVVGAWGPKVMEELSIGPTELANLMMAPLLISLFLGLLSGNFGDRFGPYRVIAIACVGTIAGVVLRIFADSFIMFFVAMLLIGLGATAMGANLPKLLAAWFKPSQMALAVSMTMFGMAAGTGLAQMTGALFPSFRDAFTFCAAMTAALVVLFCIVVRDRPKGEAVPAAAAGPAKAAKGILGETLRNPHVYLIAIMMALFSGWQMIFASFLPTMMNLGKGLDLAAAGSYSSAFAWGGLSGCIICPALAARLGKMKPVIMGGALLAGASVYLAWLTAPSVASVIFLALSGVGGAAISCLITTAPALLPSIGPAKAGTAGGVMGTLAPLGGYAIPSLLVTPIAGDNYTLMTIMGAVTVALGFFVMFGLPEYAPPRGPKPSAAKGASASA